ncbi:uncharacterized protein EV154DRAFT_258598 [Mucor mucedo]|uniref:uncharacterized protein n=1 Tax=Mucor mucedo TaxID=29922 RepID=UPI00221F1642|nr:uncharacterized protein EV154DRAFT_258598 [Mucor mucedo]KAI7896219.1 hypothetical protein EV154DRAFT_258598 [Mucor mucedo]
MTNSLYSTLGVNEKANPPQIRQAFLALTQSYNSDNSEKFKEISDAYCILSDTHKRSAYDLERKKAIANTSEHSQSTSTENATQVGAPVSKAAAVANAAAAAAAAEAAAAIAESKAAEAAAAVSKAVAAEAAAKAKAAAAAAINRSDYRIFTSVKITLAQAFTGVASFSISYDQKIVCQSCQGQTCASKPICEPCEGLGRVSALEKHITLCPKCNGTGYKKGAPKCQTCKGVVTTRAIHQNVTIPKGLVDNQEYIIANKGEFLPDGTQGDLILQMQVEQASGNFQIFAKGLHVNYEVSLKDAIMGIPREHALIHLDGHPLYYKQAPGAVIAPNSHRLFPNWGMPIYNDPNGARGDLFVTFKVIFPANICLPNSQYVIDGIHQMFETEAERKSRETVLTRHQERTNVKELLSKALDILGQDCSNKRKR